MYKFLEKNEKNSFTIVPATKQDLIILSFRVFGIINFISDFPVLLRTLLSSSIALQWESQPLKLCGDSTGVTCLRSAR